MGDIFKLTSELSKEDIAAYIKAFLASGALGKSKRREELLRYILNCEFSDQGHMLKAYSIGVDVYGRPSDFDPTSDSVVRVEMGRLRTAIKLFEASPHADTRVKVEIPVGSYRPTITERVVPDNDDQKLVPNGKRMILYAIALIMIVAGILISTDWVLRPEPSAISVVVLPEDSIHKEAETMTATLSSLLARTKTIKVLEPNAGDPTVRDARFLVTIDVLNQGYGYSANVELKSLESNRIIWANNTTLTSSDSLKRHFEELVARELRTQLFNASKNILATRNVDDLSPEELFIMSTWVPSDAHESNYAWELSRIELAKMALEQDPNLGGAHSVLADKYAYLANIYAPSDTPANREASMYHARRAMELNSLNPDVVFNVSLAYWHNGMIAESLALTKRVIELDPSHSIARFLANVIPYSCAVAPDDVLEEAIAFDKALPKENPIRWVTLNWIGWLHAYRDDWELALDAEEAAARIFQIPYTFMRRAMILNQLGKSQDAARVISEQSNNWPNFNPNHFVMTTIPNLCADRTSNEPFVTYYRELVNSINRLN